MRRADEFLTAPDQQLPFAQTKKEALQFMGTVFSIHDNPRAKLLVELPANRYRLLSPEGRVPQIGDIVVLDQGFTGADGLPMVVAYFPVLGNSHYEAEIYESELE